jgi:hypothetical protein
MHPSIGCPAANLNLTVLAGHIGIRPGMDMEIDGAWDQSVYPFFRDVKMFSA